MREVVGLPGLPLLPPASARGSKPSLGQPGPSTFYLFLIEQLAALAPPLPDRNLTGALARVWGGGNHLCKAAS